jgi:hypothetical protein
VTQTIWIEVEHAGSYVGAGFSPGEVGQPCERAVCKNSEVRCLARGTHSWSLKQTIPVHPLHTSTESANNNVPVHPLHTRIESANNNNNNNVLFGIFCERRQRT